MKFKINEKYIVKSDNHNWILQVVRSESEDNGDQYHNYYYNNLNTLINSLIARGIRNSDAETLKDALKDVERIVNDVTKAFEPEFEVRRIEK